MSDAGGTLYPFPEELLRIPRDASAVIEASAGTGKTYLLEHLVVDRIVRGEARLEEILVVTFTEKAASELVRRVRATIGALLAHDKSPPDAGPERSWRVDAVARERLRAALGAFDRATITTIHGFCQRVLTENAFASGRLLAQQHVDSAKAFGDAFKEALRAELAGDPRCAPYLRAWIAAGKPIARLEKSLHAARVLRRPFGVRHDETRLRAAAETYSGIRINPLLKEKIKQRTDGIVARWTEPRALIVRDLCLRFLAHRDAAAFLLEVDQAVDAKKDLFSYVEERVRPPFAAESVALFLDAFLAVGEAAIPLEAAICQLFLPLVEARLEARKRAAGLFDFDDMLSQVAEALRGPRAPALVASLRRRYRLAIIDEFQDTDTVQWEIFRALFHDSDGANPLYIVGDPKQSIYSFRGADLPTYEQARHAISGGDAPTLRLGRNFRSDRAVVDAYNAILDPDADPAFFSDPRLYPEPAVSALGDGDAAPDGPPVRLLAVRPAGGAEITRLPLSQVRQALTRAIAREIQTLRAGAPPPPLREIFVLTRTNVEARQVAAALREAGIPHVFYNQEKLYETNEARDVLDVLRAIDDPRDPARRMRAWLTPFFGLSLGDLPAGAAVPAGHPLEERLFSWRALAEARDWARLYARILDDSGLPRRELLVGGGARRLTNVVHLFELLLGEGTRTAASLSDLVMRLGALTEKVTIPQPEEGNVQRIEGDRDAVQIMTMHKAKGLEADHVFVYGAFAKFGGYGVRAYARGRERVLFAGRPRRSDVEEALQDEADGDDQRLLYVALTRARRRLYLPFGGKGSADIEREPGREEVYFRIGGAYRHLHQRLRALRAAGDARLDADEREVEVPAPPDDRAARVAARLAAYAPLPQTADPHPSPLPQTGEGTRDLLSPLPSAGEGQGEGLPSAGAGIGDLLSPLPSAREGQGEGLPSAGAGIGDLLSPLPSAGEGQGEGLPSRELADLRRRHAGIVLTSYSRLREAHAPAPPTEVLDEIEAPFEPGEGALPGGAPWGIFLHAVLEEVPLDSLADLPPLEAWAARPAIASLLESTMRRYGREARHRAEVARVVHAALTTPLPLGDALPGAAPLPGIAAAARVAREVQFLFPFPEAAGGAGRGFVKGFIDVVFEHEGRTYFGDWKSDLLPSFGPAAVAAHVAGSYELQRRLYALALRRMLGIADRADHEARFGGAAYVFLRALPGGVDLRRPSWDELRAWEEDLAREVA